MNTKYFLIPFIFSSLVQCALTSDMMDTIESKDAMIETFPKKLLEITESENRIIVKIEAIEKSTDRYDRYTDPTINLCFIIPSSTTAYPLKIKTDEAIPCPEFSNSTFFTTLKKPPGLFFINNKYIIKSPDNYDIFCDCKDFPDNKELSDILVGKGFFSEHYIILFKDGSAYALNSTFDKHRIGQFTDSSLDYYLNTDTCDIISFRSDICEKKSIFHSKPNFGKVGDYYTRQPINQINSNLAYISVLLTGYRYINSINRSKIDGNYFTFQKDKSNLPYSISYVTIMPSTGNPYKSRVKKERILLLPLSAVFDIILLPITIPLFALAYSMKHE